MQSHWERYAGRVFVALLLLPALYLILSTGGLPVALLSFVVQYLSWMEYGVLRPLLITNLTNRPHLHGPTQVSLAGVACSALSVALAWYKCSDPYAYAPMLALFIAIVLPVIDLVRPHLVLNMTHAPVKRKPSNSELNSDLVTALAALLVDSFFGTAIVAGLTSVIPLSARVTSNNEDTGLSLTIFAFLIPWVADTAALFAGSQFGRRKAVPGLSPNKTFVGFAAMVPGAVASAAFFKVASSYCSWRALAFYRLQSMGMICALATAAAVMGGLGDLIESAMKRVAKVKDTGDVFGPHGGVIDRVDSIVPVMLLLNMVV